MKVGLMRKEAMGRDRTRIEKLSVRVLPERRHLSTCRVSLRHLGYLHDHEISQFFQVAFQLYLLVL